MPSREEAALRVYILRERSSWQFCSVTADTTGPNMPADVDLFIADVTACGLMPWKEASEQRISGWAKDAAIVFVHPKLGEAWRGLSDESSDGRPLLWLARPYSSTLVSATLQEAVERRSKLTERPLARPGVSPALTSSSTAAGRSNGAPARTASNSRIGTPDTASKPDAVQAPAHAPSPAQGQTTIAGRTGASDLAALVTLFPVLRHQQSLLQGVARIATDHRVHEIRLAAGLAFVLHPGEGWVAGDAVLPVLEHLQRNPRLAAQVSAQAISGADAWSRLAGATSAKQSLDTFLWRWAAAAIEPDDLKTDGDALFWLRAVPNFTRLVDCTDLDLRIAAVSLRKPCRISALEAMFRQHPREHITRFVLLATLAGLAQVRQPGQHDGHNNNATAAAASQERRGLFRAILNKLYRRSAA